MVNYRILFFTSVLFFNVFYVSTKTFNISKKAPSTDGEFMGYIEHSISPREIFGSGSDISEIFVQPPWQEHQEEFLSKMDWEKFSVGSYPNLARTLTLVNSVFSVCKGLTQTEKVNIMVQAIYLGTKIQTILHDSKKNVYTREQRDIVLELTNVFFNSFDTARLKCFKKTGVINTSKCFVRVPGDTRYNVFLEMVSNVTFSVSLTQNTSVSKSIPGSDDMSFKKEVIGEFQNAYQNPKDSSVTADWVALNVQSTGTDADHKNSLTQQSDPLPEVFDVTINLTKNVLNCWEVDFYLINQFEDTWINLQTMFPSYITDVIMALEEFEDNRMVNSEKSVFRHTHPGMVEDRIEALFRLPLGEREKPELLSLMFEGLQSSGLTGLAVTRSAPGVFISSLVSMTGYFGQAGVLLNKIINPAPADNTHEKYRNTFRVFMDQTGRQKCVQPAGSVFATMVGNRLFSDKPSEHEIWMDTLMTRLIVTTGQGIVNKDILVGCFDTGLKSLTVSDTSVLKWSHSEDYINYWYLTNIDHHLKTHDKLLFTCGSEPTLEVIKEETRHAKIWTTSFMRSSDNFSLCDINPFAEIHWTLPQGCSVDPTDLIRGSYKCSQMYSASKEGYLLTDVSSQGFLKTFGFNVTSWNFNPNSKITNRSKCLYDGPNTCAWPERLWTYPMQKQRTFNVTLGSNISTFSFQCPEDSKVVVDGHPNAFTWTVSSTNKVRITVKELTKKHMVTFCRSRSGVTDKFVIFVENTVLGSNLTITKVLPMDWGREFFQTKPNVLWAKDESTTYEDSFFMLNGTEDSCVTTHKPKDIPLDQFIFSCQNTPTKTCTYRDDTLTCYGFDTSKSILVSFFGQNMKYWNTRIVFVKAPMETPSDNEWVPTMLFQKYKETEALLELTTANYSTIINTMKTVKWPGTVFATASQLVKDWSDSEEAEAARRQQIKEKILGLWREIQSIIKSHMQFDSEHYCCLKVDITVPSGAPEESESSETNVNPELISFWTEDKWSCDYSWNTYKRTDGVPMICPTDDSPACVDTGEPVAQCFNKNGMTWPSHLLVHHDVISQGEFLTESLINLIAYAEFSEDKEDIRLSNLANEKTLKVLLTEYIEGKSHSNITDERLKTLLVESGFGQNDDYIGIITGEYDESSDIQKIKEFFGINTFSKDSEKSNGMDDIDDIDDIDDKDNLDKVDSTTKILIPNLSIAAQLLCIIIVLAVAILSGIGLIACIVWCQGRLSYIKPNKYEEFKNSPSAESLLTTKNECNSGSDTEE